jgi:hypothetical protein
MASASPATEHRARLRVELLATLDCPHAERAEGILRDALVSDGHESSVERIYVSNLDHAAGLGFRGSPTIRIDGVDVMPASQDLPIGLSCRIYPQPDGRVDGVVPAETIVAELRRRRDDAAAVEAAKTHLRDVPGRVSRVLFLWASRRQLLGRMATAFPLTRKMVKRFVAGFSLSDALEALEPVKSDGMTWTVDVLGESVSTREAATAAADRYIETLDALAERGLDANV